MTRRSIGRIVAIVAIAPLMILTLFSAPGGIRVATADQCPDAEVVFARGTGEPVGPGGAGQAFIDSLTAQLPGRSVNVYPVNYPATSDYVNSALAGAGDAGAHVQSMVANCPNTKMVLGGYSQGAGVVDITSPTGYRRRSAITSLRSPSSAIPPARTQSSCRTTRSRRSARPTVRRQSTSAFPTT